MARWGSAARRLLQDGDQRRPTGPSPKKSAETTLWVGVHGERRRQPLRLGIREGGLPGGKRGGCMSVQPQLCLGSGAAAGGSDARFPLLALAGPGRAALRRDRRRKAHRAALRDPLPAGFATPAGARCQGPSSAHAIAGPAPSARALRGALSAHRHPRPAHQGRPRAHRQAWEKHAKRDGSLPLPARRRAHAAPSARSTAFHLSAPAKANPRRPVRPPRRRAPLRARKGKSKECMPARTAPSRPAGSVPSAIREDPVS